MARTIFVLRRIRKMDGRLLPQVARSAGGADTGSLLFLSRNRIRGGGAVLLELVVQSLEADPEDFRGSGFVVAGGLKRLQDEHFFGFADGSANSEANGVW